MRTIIQRIAIVGLGLTTINAAIAQDRTTDPMKAVEIRSAERPITFVRSDDPAVAGVRQRLVGSYRGTVDDELNDETPILWNSVEARVTGMTDTVYFEIARADARGEPFRQGYMQAYSRRGQPSIRLFEIADANLASMLAGLWAHPAAIPEIDSGVLRPMFDLAVEQRGETIVARTVSPVVTTLGGATEMTSEMRLGTGTIELADRGFLSDGTQIWGPESDAMIRLSSARPGVRVERRDNGLVIIHMTEADAGAAKVTEESNIAVRFKAWQQTGELFNSSENAQQGVVPVRLPTGIAGVDQGILGAARGSRVKLIIPPALAYGDEGRGMIPPNTTLVFDLDIVWHAEDDPPADEVAADDQRQNEGAPRVKIEDIKIGTGEVCPPGATVRVHYKGMLASDGTVFDSSHDRGQPATFPLGSLIKGWQEGIPGMKVGGKRKLTIPWQLGYGERGAGNLIPPRADLVFEIELLGIE